MHLECHASNSELSIQASTRNSLKDLIKLDPACTGALPLETGNSLNEMVIGRSALPEAALLLGMRESFALFCQHWRGPDSVQLRPSTRLSCTASVCKASLSEAVSLWNVSCSTAISMCDACADAGATEATDAGSGLASDRSMRLLPRISAYATMLWFELVVFQSRSLRFVHTVCVDGVIRVSTQASSSNILVPSML